MSTTLTVSAIGVFAAALLTVVVMRGGRNAVPAEQAPQAPEKEAVPAA
ncbi:hypothetical protein [Streptomyces sp. NPDC051310]